ncbi:MAG: NAD(+)/NADH kinase [Oscillospiraceae bacterium]|nr:NAD(+)/NADH kinase [Oscillospiraceae bacterium]MDD6503617.1 NAD(+)/NADH kinase [Oscillospiraceae bacterium]MDY4105654.1 NAD(+)/NADH kinase [Oscillospiraceae bacterium]
MNEQVVICPNFYRDDGFKEALLIHDVLQAEGIPSAVYPLFISLNTPEVQRLLERVPLAQSLESARLLIAIGGDGTVLFLARRSMEYQIPVIGVNLGDKGFLAELDGTDMAPLIAAARGDFRESHRMMLDVQLVRNGEVVYEDTALNDVVLKSVHNCIAVTTKIRNEVTNRFCGDGIIVATPTGSTGYSLSAGGPIVEPEAENMVITPLAAHLLSAKAFVVSGNREVEITADRVRGRPTVISVDGNDAIDFLSGDELIVRKSQHETIIADMQLRPFYERMLDILSR